jgi:hypothetical protein
MAFQQLWQEKFIRTFAPFWPAKAAVGAADA